MSPAGFVGCKMSPAGFVGAKCYKYLHVMIHAQIVRLIYVVNIVSADMYR